MLVALATTSSAVANLFIAVGERPFHFPPMSSSTRSILRFLGTMLAAYAAWYVLYDLWLLPDGRLDAWASRSAATAGGGLLSAVGLDVAVDGRVVSVAEAAGIIIVNGCNGLSTIGLFSGFVLAFPGRWARRAWFLPVGAVVLYLSNVVRVALLAGLQPHWPSAFDGLHAVGTQFFYLVVFGLWVLWVRYGGFGAADA